MRTKLNRHTVLATFGLLLMATPAACQNGADVTVRESPTSTAVSVKLISSEKPACIDDLAIFIEGSSMPLWHVATAPRAICISALVVGHEPAAFAADTGMTVPRLLSTQAYRVEVSGRGFIAATRLAAGRIPALHRDR